MDSATLESTRLFVHCQKGRRRKIRKDDADGAYLQASLDESKREQGLYADLPRCMWPDGSGAENLRHPVFRMHVSQYGIDDAGFNWDRYSRKQLVEKDFHPYYDISLSLFDHSNINPVLRALRAHHCAAQCARRRHHVRGCRTVSCRDRCGDLATHRAR